MSAAVTCTPASPKHLVDAAIIGCTGQLTTDNCVLHLAAPAGSTPALDMQSAVFQPDSAGLFKWLPLVFPVSGTWVLRLNKASDGTQIATGNITVT